MTSAPLSGWTPPPRPPRAPLAGAHVRLDPLSPHHAPALHAAFANDDRIWEYMPYGPFTAAEYDDWVRDMSGRDDPMFFAIKASGRAGPEGVASLMRMSPETGVIEVGHICLAPALQRTRAASEAIYLFASHVFALGYRRFEWKCNARNLTSRRAAQRFGFSYEGTFRQHMIVKGRNRDTAWFAMTDGDWQGLRAAWETWLAPANFGSDGRQRQRLGVLTAPHLATRDPALPGAAG